MSQEKHTKDFVPDEDAAYDKFFKNITQYVAKKCGGDPPEWTHIPQAARTALSADYGAWYTAYGPTTNTHTSEDTAEKNRVKKATKKRLRTFIKVYLRYHPDVTNKDRDNCGIPNDDETRTPVPDPPTRPEFIIKLLDIMRLAIHFWDQGSSRKAKPYGIDGAVIYWAILDHVPAGIEELVNSVLATRTPHVLEFTERDRGKTVYIALRWQNEKGRKGPPSEIQSAIIP
jgi:hypothetical protein